jgi:hypothetical protein
MADYLITGRKGNGKGLYGVLLIRDALAEGKRVATNMDINLSELFGPFNRYSYTRLPDRPTVEELDALGRGQDGVLEEDNGVILLDEASHFLNSRDWSDKNRKGVLDWLTMSRKLGWDTHLVAQGVEQLDKQVRTTQVEYRTDLKRTDKWPIPIVTRLTAAMFGYKNRVRFPAFHIAVTKQGMDRNAFHIETRWFRGAELYAAYNTQQLFLDRDHPEFTGMHTVLSNWYTQGRYMHEPFKPDLKFWILFPPRLLIYVSHRLYYLMSRGRPAKPAPAL